MSNVPASMPADNVVRHLTRSSYCAISDNGCTLAIYTHQSQSHFQKPATKAPQARVKCEPVDRPTGKLRTTKMRTPRNRTPNERCAIMCMSLL